ncbi:MAG: Stk1 family PASTA domain-containing Ser/Thr kinase [Chloroflexota bacterium]
MIGRLINGRYRLIAPLGEGGMATLWRAVDEQLDREVAVKLLRPQYSADPGFARRFKQEARSAGSLAHPNIVSVYDYGQDGEDAATQYIVMQLVDGQDLSGLLRERGRLSVSDAVRIALGVAAALEAAHRRGIVHRDVKPGNILITDDGDVKVTDFGIARAVSETSMTVTGTTLGSVHYFSPEQARGDEVTGASDVYALGIVLYEMLTGRRPFEGDSAAGVALKRLTDDPPPPSEFNGNLPPALVAIVMRSLARDIADRYPDAGAMAEALRGYQRDPGALPPAVVSGIPAPLPAAGSPTVYIPPPVQRPADRAPAMPPPARREPRYVDEPYRDDRGGTAWWTWLLGLLGVVLLAAIGFIGAQLLGLGGTTEPSPSAAVTFELPNWVDDPITAVRLDAEERGLTLDEVKEPSSDVERDRVISTEPQAGAEVTEGDTITVVVSDGPPETTVPNISGQTVDQATNSLAAENLDVGAIVYQYDPAAPSGTVISTTPGAGEAVTEGSRVALVVSQGPEPTPTPSPSPTPTPVPETPPPTPIPTPSPPVAP